MRFFLLRIDAGFATSTACDSNTVQNVRKPYIFAVVPVETISQITSATLRLGANSTEPLNSTISARILLFLKNDLRIVGYVVPMR